MWEGGGIKKVDKPYMLHNNYSIPILYISIEANILANQFLKRFRIIISKLLSQFWTA